MHVSQSDKFGGAARAALRIHHVVQGAEIRSLMRVIRKGTDDSTVIGGRPRGVGRIAWHAGNEISRQLDDRARGGAAILHSTAWPSTGLVDELNCADNDVVHLHWLGSRSLSIEEVGRINKAVVWTLHDMWAFCGAEHVVEDSPNSPFRTGYLTNHHLRKVSPTLLNRWTWGRKRSSWKSRKIQVVCPSNWLARCASESSLMNGWNISVIPNPIDSSDWRLLDRRLAREVLGLDPSPFYVVLGAYAGLNEHHKGFDLAAAALNVASRQVLPPMQILVFGQSAHKSRLNLPFPTHFFGHIESDLELSLLYNAADALLLPSRQDNLPNTMLEAMACGTPVIGFDIGGLPDLIRHQSTGWLAKPFDAVDLAAGLSWAQASCRRTDLFRREVRRSVLALCDAEVVREKYVDVYQTAVYGTR